MQLTKLCQCQVSHPATRVFPLSADSLAMPRQMQGQLHRVFELLLASENEHEHEIGSLTGTNACAEARLILFTSN